MQLKPYAFIQLNLSLVPNRPKSEISILIVNAKMGPKEENKMGKWGATSYIVGNIVGSGIFITPSTILNNTHSVGLAMVVWFFSAAIATLGAYCYVELGTSVPRSGSDFAYLRHVKWNAIAFTYMCSSCIIIQPLTLAIQADTFAEYFIEGFSLGPAIACAGNAVFYLHKLIAFAVIWFLLYINMFSLRLVGSRFQIAAALAKLLATALIASIGAYLLIFRGQYHNLENSFANSTFEPAQLTNAFFAGLFSYDGWDVLNFGAEEVQNPKSTMLFAILVGMGCVTAIYASINLSYFVVLNVFEIQNSAAVAMTFADHTMGRFKKAMPLVINIVMFGALNGTIFPASRYLFAAARERQLPSFIACINRYHDSPRAALFVHVFIAFVFSFIGNTEELIGYVGFSQWLQHGFAMCALLYMRYTNWPVHKDAIHVPLVFPFLFLALCFSLVAVTLFQNFQTAYIGIIVLSVAFLIYMLFLWEPALPRFAVYRTVTSQLNEFSARAVQVALDGEIDLAEDDEEILQKHRGKNKVWPAKRQPTK